LELFDRPIYKNNPPFPIAEMSGNHGGDIECPLNLVELAADCGCDAFKLQTFSLDKMTMDTDGEEA